MEEEADAANVVRRTFEMEEVVVEGREEAEEEDERCDEEEG